ncbi:MAG: OmpH family outer membrane protein, partial [bacterium]
QRNAELTKPLLDKINSILQELSSTERVDIILDISSGAVAYGKPELDLTDKLLERLNKGK